MDFRLRITPAGFLSAQSSNILYVSRPLHHDGRCLDDRGDAKLRFISIETVIRQLRKTLFKEALSRFGVAFTALAASIGICQALEVGSS